MLCAGAEDGGADCYVLRWFVHNSPPAIVCSQCLIIKFRKWHELDMKNKQSDSRGRLLVSRYSTNKCICLITLPYSVLFLIG